MKIMLELKNMSLEELKSLESQVKAEIADRQQPELVVYSHGCKKSARYHLGKYKHWAKLVKSVDTTKTNGYAFAGDFLKVEAEHKVPVGSIIIEVCGSTITAYEMTKGGKVKIDHSDTRSMSNFIDKIATWF